jgi:hypothetical protein
MSAGSDASNLGYAKYPLNSNVNPAYVNVGNTNNPANFGSNEIPPRGLFGASCNMDAAAGFVPGCMSGGKKRNKAIKSNKYKELMKKIKNISNIYKMKYTKKQRKQIKRKISRKYRLHKHSKMRKHSSGKSRKSHHKRTKSQRGGKMAALGFGNYPASDSNNNINLSYKDTISSGYGFAPNIVNNSSSALANPMPHKSFSNMH